MYFIQKAVGPVIDNRRSHDNTIDTVITIVSERRERFMFIGPQYSVTAGRN